MAVREVMLNKRSVAGLKPEDLKGVVKFNPKTGELVIQDYTRFDNQILGKLAGHANANIGESSDALAYANNTAQREWQQVMKFRGDGIRVGDIANSELIRNAEVRVATRTIESMGLGDASLNITKIVDENTATFTANGVKIKFDGQITHIDGVELSKGLDITSENLGSEIATCQLRESITNMNETVALNVAETTGINTGAPIKPDQLGDLQKFDTIFGKNLTFFRTEGSLDLDKVKFGMSHLDLKQSEVARVFGVNDKINTRLGTDFSFDQTHQVEQAGFRQVETLTGVKIPKDAIAFRYEGENPIMINSKGVVQMPGVDSPLTKQPITEQLAQSDFTNPDKLDEVMKKIGRRNLGEEHTLKELELVRRVARHDDMDPKLLQPNGDVMQKLKPQDLLNKKQFEKALERVASKDVDLGSGKSQEAVRQHLIKELEDGGVIEMKDGSMKLAGDHKSLGEALNTSINNQVDKDIAAAIPGELPKAADIKPANVSKDIVDDFKKYGAELAQDKKTGQWRVEESFKGAVEGDKFKYSSVANFEYGADGKVTGLDFTLRGNGDDIFGAQTMQKNVVLEKFAIDPDVATSTQEIQAQEFAEVSRVMDQLSDKEQVSELAFCQSRLQELETDLLAGREVVTKASTSPGEPILSGARRDQIL